MGTGIVETETPETASLETRYCSQFWDDAGTYCSTRTRSSESVFQWDGGRDYRDCT